MDEEGPLFDLQFQKTDCHARDVKETRAGTAGHPHTHSPEHAAFSGPQTKTNATHNGLGLSISVNSQGADHANIGKSSIETLFSGNSMFAH